ncbi:MAG TPA: MASE1 domain-containing protein [Xanthobacteraceae bacterium]|nr:MASE1 domain-containing protein [Xanthobacteraceae bacterium]
MLEAAALDEPATALSGVGYLLLMSIIFVLSLITIVFARRSDLIATIWPSNAIILAALLRHARDPIHYPMLLAGGAAASALGGLVAGNSPIFCVMMFVANIVEISTALALLKLLRVEAFNLTSLRNLIIFIAIAAGVAPIGSTMIAALGFHRLHEISWPVVARNWYSGHALGMIIIVPFLISITSKEWHDSRARHRVAEAAGIVAIFIAISICVVYFRPFVFLLAPAILLSTLRFGIVGATTSTLLIAIVATLFAVLGIGHPMIANADITTRIFTLQMFLAITSFWSLPAGALLTERERLLADLSHANAQLAADSESKSHLVTGLRRHLSKAEENERLRLSHELHDQAGQSLIAAILELNEIDGSTSGAGRKRLHRVRKRMVEMGKTLHRIAWELRPPSIDELGLRKALASYIAEWSEQCGTEIDFHCADPNLDEVPDEIATAVYRVVQEGLTNIVKHAQRPSLVSVVIRRTDATLQVIIEDNGCGFDIGAQASRVGNHRGLGLEGMRERLGLIGGTLDVESAPGLGTTIFARITLDGQRPVA